MEAIVLAGGFATRLWPLTKDRAKPLLPLGDREIVDYLLDEIVGEPRIDRVYLSTNKRFEKDFQNYVDSRGYSDVEVVVEDSVKEGEKPGAIGALHQLIDSENLEGPLLVVAGDNYVSFSVTEFIDFYLEGEGSCLAAYDLDGDPSQFGVLKIDGEKVIDFEEKPSDPKSSLISIAFYILSEEGLDLLNNYMERGLNPDSPGYFIEWLIDHEYVRSFKFEGDWFDIGTPTGYIDAYSTVVGQNTFINSDIKNSDVEISYVENSSIMDSQVVESILIDGAEVKKSDLKRAIIEGTEISDEEVEDEVVSYKEKDE